MTSSSSSASAAPERRRRPRRAPDVAAWQDGVFTIEQALAEGWTPRQVRRRRATGAWVPVLGRGLIARPATDRAPDDDPFQYDPAFDQGTSSPRSTRVRVRPTHLQRCWAVALTWPDRCISHTSAARLLGWPVTGSVEVDVLAPRGAHPARGLRIRTGHLTPAEVVEPASGLRVTSPSRTAVDCLATLPMSLALELHAWLVVGNRFSRPELAAAVRGRTGLRGTPQLLSLLRLTRRGALSVGEYRLHGILDAGGISGWRANVAIRLPDRTVVADVLFEAERLVLEFDGRRAHGSKEAFERDRRRQNALHRAGYLVLRYTWADVTERPGQIIREVADLLAARRVRS